MKYIIPYTDRARKAHLEDIINHVKGELYKMARKENKDVKTITDYLGGRGLFENILTSFRVYCVFLFVTIAYIMFILFMTSTLSLPGNSSDILLLVPPLYLSYTLKTIDDFIKKIAMVKYNMIALQRFMTDFETPILEKSGCARIYIYNTLFDLSLDFESYNKEMRGILTILIKILTLTPPLYHQNLEEVNIVQDRLKYVWTLPYIPPDKSKEDNSELVPRNREVILPIDDREYV